MRTLLLLTVFAVAVPDRPDPTPRKEAPKPADHILGEWVLEKMIVGGAGGVAAPMNNEVRSLQFTPSEIIVKVNGQPRPDDSTTYTIDWSKQPTAIDVIPKKGPKMHGIVKVEADVLTFCFGLGETARPRVFDASGGELVVLMVLKRAK